MTAQDTDNQLGGAAPAEEPPVDETGGEPGAPADNPYEALKEQGLQFIIRCRQLGKEPVAVIQEVLEDIKD